MWPAKNEKLILVPHNVSANFIQLEQLNSSESQISGLLVEHPHNAMAAGKLNVAHRVSQLVTWFVTNLTQCIV